ncbi:MAG TPA: hypothetical protein VFC45_03295 [Pseudolabrys sp.]|nr:hypothetical protein [Pseudolabrys sp.]
MLAMTIALAPVSALAAGGAYVVDDVAIDKPGACKVESWAAAASNHDFTAVTSPACVVKLGIPVELGGQLQRSRDDGIWSTTGTLKAKTNIIPFENHPFGLGISGGSSWDLVSGMNTGGFINVPVTIKVTDKFHFNLNSGWLYDNVAKISYLTWGAGFEWGFVDKFTLIGEVFGQVGALPAVDPGSPLPLNSIREPRTQLGVRFNPQENIDIDVIWGHNITGENAQWATLGLNVRFDLGH